MDNVLFLQCLQHTDKKSRTVSPRRNPFSEYDEHRCISLPSPSARLSPMMSCCNLAGISSYP